MRSLLLALTCSLALAASSASAAPMLDQEYDPIGGSGRALATASRAQTFTVGTSGRLTGAEVKLQALPSQLRSFGPIGWSIRSTTSGVPDAASLLGGSLSVPTTDFFPTFFSLDFMGATLDVTAGDVLAIVLDSDTPTDPTVGPAAWIRQSGDGYSGGELWTLTSSANNEPENDFAFRTFVDSMDPDPDPSQPIPEPSAALAFALGMGLVGTRRRALRP